MCVGGGVKWNPAIENVFAHQKTEKDLKTSIPLKFVEGSVSEHLLVSLR